MIKKFIQMWARRRSYKAAVKTADALRAKNFKKHLVMLNKGEFIVVTKQRIKELHKAGVFKKGNTIREIESCAVYTTK